jgi:hypothetical protein
MSDSFDKRFGHKAGTIVGEHPGEHFPGISLDDGNNDVGIKGPGMFQIIG